MNQEQTAKAILKEIMEFFEEVESEKGKFHGCVEPSIAFEGAHRGRFTELKKRARHLLSAKSNGAG